MEPARLRSLLEEIRAGTASIEDAVARLAGLPALELGHSRLDTARAARCGFPEVIFGAGKSPDELVEIATALLAQHGRLLVTRADELGAERLLAEIPGAERWARSGAITVGMPSAAERIGDVLVISAGTADGPVAEEALVTARMLGARAETLRDVGVAGIHRLLAHADRLRAARALVVVAGMEGALPSVVGGLVDRPVIAVPTSIGYGASFGGIAALLGMLNSCASGVTVVNIDNGFGAGYAAALINRLPAPTPPPR
jgi:NCAIR mutase (PurE)-related protein